MAINLGSRGIEDARSLLEYCNDNSGAAWETCANSTATRNRSIFGCGAGKWNGWSLAGRAQTAYEYGRLANETAKTYRKFDEDLELIVCGSSNDKMATYPNGAEVLDQSYDQLTISLHKYWNNYQDTQLPCQSLWTGWIHWHRPQRHPVHQGQETSKEWCPLCFDEWNPWYHTNKRTTNSWRPGIGPKLHLFEDPYNLEDALLVGTVINSFIRNADIVKITCMASSSMSSPISLKRRCLEADHLLSILLGFQIWSGHCASSSGCFTNIWLYDSWCASYLDTSVVLNEERKEVSVFCVNKHPDQALHAEISLENFSELSGLEHICLTGPDRYMTNTVQQPDRVVPQLLEPPKVSQTQSTVSLPPLSFNVLAITTEHDNIPRNEYPRPQMQRKDWLCLNGSWT